MPRLVSSAHNSNEENRLHMLAYRLTDPLADISTNVSEKAVQTYIDRRALRSGRMVAIHNGIDAQMFVFEDSARKRLRSKLAIADTTPMLLAVGRLREQKNYPNLVRALARLQDFGHRPCLLVAGEGPLRSYLEELAESLSVASQVHFLGMRHDVPDLMSACDVFVLSSDGEGFGLVVAEAMACERVIVATGSGGVCEVVGDTGFLASPRDTDALANALARALSLTSENTKALGQRARQRVVEHYSIAATAAHYLAVFRGDPPMRPFGTVQ